MNVDLKISSAGFCMAGGNHAQRGSKKENIQFNAVFALIKHPSKGYVLFDTGYTKRFFEAAKKFPYQIYAAITKVTLNEGDEVVDQLKTIGITTADIKYIIISHFHADHIGGLRDFPNAQFICTEIGYKDVKGKSGFSGLIKAFMPLLMPKDFENRSRFIDIGTATITHPDLGKMIDVFDDGTIMMFALDGHALGMIGILVKTNLREVLLVSDAAWLKSNYQDLKLPHPIVKLFFNSWNDFKDSINRIHQFYKNNPNTLIVPSHCMETYITLPQDVKW